MASRKHNTQRVSAEKVFLRPSILELPSSTIHHYRTFSTCEMMSPSIPLATSSRNSFAMLSECECTFVSRTVATLKGNARSPDSLL